jgi:hypothetical protein
LRLLSKPIALGKGVDSSPILGPSLVGITIKDRVDLWVELKRDVENLKVSRRVPLYYSN